jgi:methylamine dehydrogenase accessory protein MauD
MVEALIISNILLWVVVVIMGLMLFALVRQIGVLYERVAPAGALMINQNLKVGADAPSLDLQDIKGELITIGGVPENGKSKLLFFASPSCPVCKTLLPVVRSADKSEKDWLDVILASDGENNDHQAYINEHKLEKFTYISSEILGRSYGVSKLPYAVLIDEQGKIASMGIINSREHLESLFESKERGVASIQDYIKTQTANEKGDDLSPEAQ